MKKIILLITLILGCLGLITGCGNDSSNSSEKTKVKISEFRGLNWSSAYIADALGYFEEEGLDVSYEIYKDGPIAFQGMHAGDSDFCLLSAEPVIRASEEGYESIFLLTNTDNRTYAFLTQPEIKDIKDLKGKTVFAGMPGSAPYSFVLSLFEEAGLSENDVNFINLEYEASVSALENKQVDGMFFDIYNKAEILKAIPDVNILIDTTNEEDHKKLYGSKYCQTTIVTCTKEFAEKNPETVQKFTNASVKALKWIDEHSTEEVADKLLPYFDGMTKQELMDKFETVKGSYSKTGEINEEGYKTVEDFCIEQGLLKEPIGYENIVESQYVKEAVNKLK